MSTERERALVVPLHFDPHVLASRLNRLFANHERAAGAKLSNDRVAAEIKVTGTSITGAYIWKLRNEPEQNKNPSLPRLLGLANFFGVKLDDLLSADGQTELDDPSSHDGATGHEVEPTEVRLKAMRALDRLSPEGFQQVMSVAEMVARLEDAERQLDARTSDRMVSTIESLKS